MERLDFIPEILSYDQDDFFNIIEEIANLGSYRVDILQGTWTGSRNFIELFGLDYKPEYTVEEFQDLVHPEDIDKVMSFYALCIEKKEPFNCEYRCVHKDGRIIYVQSRSRIFYDEETGQPLYTVGIKQDITQFKESEILLKKLNELNNQKNILLGEVAHDFRQPISQIRGWLSLIQMEYPEFSKNMVELLENSMKEMVEYVNELMELSNVEGLDTDLSFEKNNLNDLVNYVYKNFSTTADSEQVKFVVQIDGNIDAVINRTKILRVLENLVSNAIKFTPGKGRVLLSCIDKGDLIEFKVSDEGIGISEDALPLLFTQNIKKLRREGLRGEKSYGLGLRIVKKIIDMHKGRISVKSRPGFGTTFTILLPKNGPDYFYK